MININTSFLITLNTVSLPLRKGEITKTKNNVIIIVSIELFVVSPRNITKEYITAKERVSHKIEYRKGKCQYPDFAERMNHTNPNK